MNILREKALALRLNGRSYNEINLALKIPKSTLSNWFSILTLPEEAKQRITSRIALGTLHGLVRRNKMQTVLARERAEKIKQESGKDIKELTKSDIRLIGAVLYWAEGYKRLKIRDGRTITNHTISLTNSDPAIIAVFITFLKKILRVPNEKIVIAMRLFKHLDEEKVMRYWMKITELPRSQFREPQYPISRSSHGKRPFNRLPYGTVQVIVMDTPMFYRVMGLIDGIKKHLHLDNL